MWITRPIRDTDWPYVIKTWMLSFESSAVARAFIKGHSRDRYLRTWHGMIETLLATFGATVACPDDDENFIAGWLCSDGNLLHYIYVRKDDDEEEAVHEVTRLLLRGTSFARISHETVDWVRVRKNRAARGLPVPAYDPMALEGFVDVESKEQSAEGVRA
jgi:hypothetical protein